MSTLFYPIVTFILIAICISYWAVTAVYPPVCAPREEQSAGLQDQMVLCCFTSTRPAFRGLFGHSALAALMHSLLLLICMWCANRTVNFISLKKTGLKFTPRQGDHTRPCVLHKVGFKGWKRALCKEWIWPLMFCMLCRAGGNGLVAGGGLQVCLVQKSVGKEWENIQCTESSPNGVTLTLSVPGTATVWQGIDKGKIGFWKQIVLSHAKRVSYCCLGQL